LAATSAFVDRIILTMMVEPIKRDFGVSDTEMGLLIGFSFVLFFSIMGLPLGRLADSGNRRNLIAVCVLLWSVFTALCGITKNYWQLFFMRFGVGFSEAGLIPAAVSLISDIVPRERRAIAMSFFRMSVFAGAGAALIISGIAVQLAAVDYLRHFWTNTCA